MFLARVEGSVVATKKDPAMSGRKLLLLRPQLVDDKDPSRFRAGVNTVVAVDSVGAGVGELVLFCQGSSARLAPNLKDAPVDAVIIGIVDSVDVLGKQIYNAKSVISLCPPQSTNNLSVMCRGGPGPNRLRGAEPLQPPRPPAAATSCNCHKNDRRPRRQDSAFSGRRPGLRGGGRGLRQIAARRRGRAAKGGRRLSRPWPGPTRPNGAASNWRKPKLAGSTIKSRSCRSSRTFLASTGSGLTDCSGDHGITLEEYTPFGVIGAVTPSTHSIPTLSGNIVNMVAAGNAVVFNAHPSASRCAALASALTTRPSRAKPASKTFAASSSNRPWTLSRRCALTNKCACSA